MSEEKITSLVKMPNEENVDTSGLSFTNCIQNRFFFPSLRHHHHHHVNWHLGWNYGLKMCSQGKSSYESTMLYIFFAKGDSFPFFIAEEEEEKIEIWHHLSSTEAFIHYMRWSSAWSKTAICILLHFFFEMYFAVIFKLISTRNVVHAQFLHFSKH